MNRHLATVITITSPYGWCDAVLLAQGQGSKPAGLLAQVVHAHGDRRESDDATTSGEGHG